MDALIVFGAKYLIYVVVLIFAAFLASAWSWRKAVLTTSSLVAGYAVARIAGAFYHHVQPFAAQNFTPLIAHAVDNAFPSDHTVIAGVLASVALLYNRTLGSILWILTIALGVARVYAGVHYPTDIIASVIIALAVTFGAHTLLSRYLR